MSTIGPIWLVAEAVEQDDLVQPVQEFRAGNGPRTTSITCGSTFVDIFILADGGEILAARGSRSG